MIFLIIFKYCAKHKLVDMIDLNNINKQCIEINCNTRANYGLPGKKPEYCAKHKKIGTIVNSRTKCKYNTCKELAFYGKHFILRGEN